MYHFNVCVIDKGTNGSGFFTTVFSSRNEIFILPLGNVLHRCIHTAGATLLKRKGRSSNFIKRLAYIYNNNYL